MLVQTYRMPDHFRLEHVQDEFNFATDDEMERSRRFRMISLRDQEVPFFKNQRIPLYDKEVPEALFAVCAISTSFDISTLLVTKLVFYLMLKICIATKQI